MIWNSNKEFIAAWLPLLVWELWGENLKGQTFWGNLWHQPDVCNKWVLCLFFPQPRRSFVFDVFFQSKGVNICCESLERCWWWWNELSDRSAKRPIIIPPVVRKDLVRRAIFLTRSPAIDGPVCWANGLWDSDLRKPQAVSKRVSPDLPFSLCILDIIYIYT